MLQMVLRVEQLHRILMTIEIAGLSQHPGITDTSALDMGIQEKQADRLSDSSEIQMWSLREAYLKVFEKKASCLMLSCREKKRCKMHEPSSTPGTNCWTPPVIKSGTTECYFTISTANSAESWISKGPDFFKSRNQHNYIKTCLHTRHCNVLLLRKLHDFSWNKKKPDVKFIKILLIRVQAMLRVTFFVHIYSVDMEKSSTRTLVCEHNQVCRIQAAHLLVC